jgi:6-pyruvoyltetrahydropterin/6-carboxytetrahydropterin synthase
VNDEITVVKEFTFEAAHHLPGYDGPCQNPHGHSYHLKVGVQGLVNPTTGMVIDFGILKQMVSDTIIENLDHKDLNAVTVGAFPRALPTAESMVLWIRDIICTISSVRVVLVELYETATSCARWEVR